MIKKIVMKCTWNHNPFALGQASTVRVNIANTIVVVGCDIVSDRAWKALSVLNDRHKQQPAVRRISIGMGSRRSSAMGMLEEAAAVATLYSVQNSYRPRQKGPMRRERQDPFDWCKCESGKRHGKCCGRR